MTMFYTLHAIHNNLADMWLLCKVWTDFPPLIKAEGVAAGPCGPVQPVKGPNGARQRCHEGREGGRRPALAGVAPPCRPS